MAETEEIIAALAQSTVAQLSQNPDLLDECLRGTRATILTQIKQWFATPGNAITVQDAYPSSVPKSPVVVITPGESEEAQQYIGEELQYYTQLSPQIAEGQAVGTQFSSTHHLTTLSSNQVICKAIGKALMWALLVARPFLLQEGIYESRIYQSPIDIASEFSPPGSGADLIFRTDVHLVHKWFMVHQVLDAGPLLKGAYDILHDDEAPALGS